MIRLLAAATLYLMLFLEYGMMRGRLPERIASHFGATGAANGFMPRDASFLTFLVILTVNVALFGMLPMLLRRTPLSLWNLPHKDYWLARERAASTVAFVEKSLLAFGFLVGVFLNALFYLSLQASLMAHPALDMRVMAGLLTGFVAGSISLPVVLLVRFGRKPKEKRRGSYFDM